MTTVSSVNVYSGSVGTALPVAVDTISAIDYQVVKLILGAYGTDSNPVSATNPMPVTAVIAAAQTLATVTTVGAVTAITNALPAGTNTIGSVVEVPAVSGGLSMYRRISTGDTNAANVKSSAGQVYGIQVFNINASPRYLKLYNKASAPTVGSDTIVKTILVPGNTSGAGAILNQPLGIAFGTGISIALTTGMGDSDTGAVGAADLVVNIDYK